MIDRRVNADLARAAEAIAARGCRLGAPLHLLSETGSTNDDAKRAAREGAPHGAVWIAEAQSRGRGRQGRSWASPPGEGLLVSVLLRVRCAPARVPLLSLAAGLAVRDAVARRVDPGRVLVKWPNDVVIRERGDGKLRKVAGILVESALAGSAVEHVVVGVGLNVHTRAFPPELSELATSIALEADAPADRAEVLADVLAALDRDLEHVAHRGLGLIHARLAACDALAGRAVASEDGRLEGVAGGIDPDGRLLVRTDDGARVRVASGEVRLRAS